MDAPESHPTLAEFLPQRLEDLPGVYARFARMREAGTILRTKDFPLFPVGEFPLWQVFRYADVQRVLGDPATFSSTGTFADAFLRETLLVKDPPAHRKLRNLVNQAFTPRAVQRLSASVAAMTQRLIDAVKAKGEMDVVEDIATPIPVLVIADLLGVPAEDAPKFHRWAAPDQGEGREEMAAYFVDLLEDRRKRPREDLLTALSVAEVDGARLSEHELVSFCFLLLVGGLQTTRDLVSASLLCFAREPGAIARLRADPSLLPTAIDEVLRFMPPLLFVLRRTTRPVELNGQLIPADQLLLAWLASGNRDGEHFADPERFLVDRQPNRHLTFGHGIHYCFGAPLARMEAAVALPMILDQLDELRLAPGAPIEIFSGLVFVIKTLRMTFRPR